MSWININKSIVLSVSVKKGCYRHIKASMNETLYDLADDIIWAFDFCNDHAHAFFMDNIWWSDSDSYYMDEVAEDGYRCTSQYMLSQLGLKKGDVFGFIFDFGDEWRFQCKVLRIEDENIEESVIIKTVGEPPEQYPDYDFEE